MANILLVWEMGQGDGAIRRLRLLASALKMRHHHITWAVYDLAVAARVLANDDDVVIQSPVARSRLPMGQRFAPTGYADYLVRDRFADGPALRALLDSWGHILEFSACDLVIGEYAPGAALASYGRVPFMWLGSGYMVPPMKFPWFPKFRDLPELLPQQQLFEVINDVQSARGAPQAKSLTAYFSGQGQLIYGIKDTDPYHKTRLDALMGPMQPSAALMPIPDVAPKFCGVFSDSHPNWRHLVDGLARSGMQGRIYLDSEDRHPELKRRLSENHIDFLDAKPDPGRLALDTAVFLHHGETDFAQAVLLAARPQLIFPRLIEEHMTGQAVARLDAGLMIGEAVTPEDVSHTVKILVREKSWREATMKWSKAARKELPLTGSVKMMVDVIESAL